MGKYTEQMKESIRRRVRQKVPLEEAYHRVATNLFKAENVWQKQIDEIKEKARILNRKLTENEKGTIGKYQDAKAVERTKRAEVEKLHEAGWDPADEQAQ